MCPPRTTVKRVTPWHRGPTHYGFIDKSLVIRPAISIEYDTKPTEGHMYARIR